MIHNLPPTPAFRDAKVDDPISEIALRVIVELPDWRFVVVGTATVICGHVAITARHVLEFVINTFGAKQKHNSYLEIDSYELKLLQLLPGPIYRFWKVYTAWPCSSDIAILHLGIDRTSIPGEDIEWRQPCLRALPPPIGHKVLAFGYRESTINVQEGADGQHHIELNDKPTTSIGTVTQVYSLGRDRVMLPFPCFEIEARFEPGMSGGMVIDESGSLCGLMCASLNQADANAPPLSYVAALWPMLKTKISVNRGHKYPRDVSYPVIDLATDGLISVKDLRQIDLLRSILTQTGIRLNSNTQQCRPSEGHFHRPCFTISLMASDPAAAIEQI
jgi:hypothetical protein